MNAAIQTARDALMCSPRDPCAYDNTCHNHKVLDDEQERLLRGHALPGGCGGCGGPHRFDTSVPSVLWNRVIRSQGISEFLCTSCIVREFARAGVSFTATLWSDEFHGLPIAVEVKGAVSTAAHELDEENNRLRSALSKVHDQAREALDDATRPRAGVLMQPDKQVPR
jgi:hypothetical protein